MQVSPAEERTGLDAELARRGWTPDGATDVLVADADAVLAATAPGERGARRPARRGLDRRLGGLRAAPGRRRARARRPRAHRARDGYARAADDLGVGLAVCERGWAGLFCVATAPSARRRGIAGHVVHALTTWAVERGARRLYLQVESANAPAHAFYERAGFARSHGYHYRAAPRRGAAV